MQTHTDSHARAYTSYSFFSSLQLLWCELLPGGGLQHCCRHEVLTMLKLRSEHVHASRLHRNGRHSLPGLYYLWRRAVPDGCLRASRGCAVFSLLQLHGRAISDGSMRPCGGYAVCELC